MIATRFAVLATCAAALAPVAAQAQDKSQMRAQAKQAVAQLRALGEPKDRCFVGAEVQDGIVVTRVDAGSAFVPGDKVLSLNGVDLSGKSADDAIAVLRSVAPGTTMPATVERAGIVRQLQVACGNSRPLMEAYALGLDQAAAGKFDECAATFGRPLSFGLSGAVMRAQCAASAKKKDERTIAELNFEVMRLAVENATYVPTARASVARQLRALEGGLTQTVGSMRYHELVALTRKWPGDETLFAKSEPDWALFRRNAEQSLRGRLIDPDSARIEWPRGFTYGAWKPLLSKRIEGYWTCGLINARNRMGGYTGSTAFVVVMGQDGSTLFADMGSGRDFDIVSSQCANSVKALPAPPAALTSDVQSTPSSGAVSPASLGDELRKLAELKASGALTEVEFQAAKQKLIGGSN